MSSREEVTVRRAAYLRLWRRKLQRELDDMGYPGGRTEGTAGGRSGGRTVVIINAGEGIDRKERSPIRRRALQR